MNEKKQLNNLHTANYKEIHNNLLDLDITEDELDFLVDSLMDYTVDIPSEEEIDKTIDTVRNYIPKKKSTFQKQLNKINFVLNLAYMDVSFISKSYWLISFLLFVLGYILTTKIHYNPYITVVGLSPVPFILGIIEVFRGREENVLEIELSCKISIQQIMLSRLILISIYNMLLNIALSSILTFSYFNINLLRITLLWLTPFTFISGMSLCIAIKVRGYYASSVCIAIWTILALSLMGSQKTRNLVMNLNYAWYLLAILSGLTLIIFGIKKIMSKHFLERSALIEINN